MARVQETQDQDVEVSQDQLPVPATNGALSFKLKIPKFENMEEDHHPAPSLAPLPSSDLLRTCSECGKQFTSGKALGGHKRACLQKISQKVTVKKVDREDTANLNNTGLNCYVCQQPFRSSKSLYGHMRKHPEREWRGIKPPPGYGNTDIHPTVDNDDNDDDDDDDKGDDDSLDVAGSTVDLVESLKGWPVKVRRGQKLSSEPRMSTSASDQDESDALQQAVNDLLMLAEHCSDDHIATSNKRGFDQVSSAGSGYGLLKIKEWRADNDQDGIKKSEILRSYNMEKGKKKISVLEAELDTKNQRCNSEDTWLMNDYEDDSEMEISRKTKHQKKKRRRLTELDDMEGLNEEAATTQTYSCPICDKVFTKHQALGGHVASHNKNKNSNVKESSASVAAVSASEDGNCDNANNTTSKVVENERQVGSEETGELSRVAAAGEEHQCNVCSKTFPTGQALGGHKRCHWTGPAEAFSSSSQVTTSAGEVTQAARRVVFDIDLNDTPPEYYQIYGVFGEEAAGLAS